ncbi:MAG: hypothetical protein KF791_00530 [Verrucomicrobiae bacterium]|nr:hypothetical protein [Verrucomicrobiae bacterium]
MSPLLHPHWKASWSHRIRASELLLAVLAVTLPVAAYIFAIRAAPAAAKASLAPILGPDAFVFLKLLVAATFAAPLVVAGLLVMKSVSPMSWRTFALGSGMVLSTAAAYFAGFQVGADRAWAIRKQILHDLAIRSEPVVTAVEAYVRTNHHPPARWADLVPAFLPTEPATGMAAHPRFELIVDPALLARRYGGNPWAVRLDIFGRSVQRWDELVFLPRQNYGDLGYSVEPAGRWALRGS